MQQVLERWAGVLRRHLRRGSAATLTSARSLVRQLASDPNLYDLFGAPKGSIESVATRTREASIARLLLLLAQKDREAHMSTARGAPTGAAGEPEPKRIKVDGDTQQQQQQQEQEAPSSATSLLPGELLGLLYLQLDQQQRSALLAAEKKLKLVLTAINNNSSVVQDNLRKYPRALAWRDGPRLHDEVWAFYEACTLKHAVWNTNTMDPYLRYKMGRFSLDWMETNKAFASASLWAPAAPLDHIHAVPSLFLVDLLTYSMIDEDSNARCHELADRFLVEPLVDLFAVSSSSSSSTAASDWNWCAPIQTVGQHPEITTDQNKVINGFEPVSEERARRMREFLQREAGEPLDVVRVLAAAKNYLFAYACVRASAVAGLAGQIEVPAPVDQPAVTEATVACQWIQRIDMVVAAILGPFSAAEAGAAAQYSQDGYGGLWAAENAALQSEARLLARCVLSAISFVVGYRRFPDEAATFVEFIRNDGADGEWYTSPFEIYSNVHSTSNYCRLHQDADYYLEENDIDPDVDTEPVDLSGTARTGSVEELQRRILWMVRGLEHLQVDVSHKLARLSDTFSRLHPRLHDVWQRVRAHVTSAAQPNFYLAAQTEDPQRAAYHKNAFVENKRMTATTISECAMARFVDLDLYNDDAGAAAAAATDRVIIMLVEPTAILQWWVPGYASGELLAQFKHSELDVENTFVVRDDVTPDDLAAQYKPVLERVAADCSVLRYLPNLAPVPSVQNGDKVVDTQGVVVVVGGANGPAGLDWGLVLMSERYRDVPCAELEQVSRLYRVAWLYCTLAWYCSRTTYIKFNFEENEDRRSSSWRFAQLSDTLHFIACVPKDVVEDADLDNDDEDDSANEFSSNIDQWLTSTALNGVRPSADFLRTPDVLETARRKVVALYFYVLLQDSEEVARDTDDNFLELYDGEEFSPLASHVHFTHCPSWW